jgi:acyl-CoA thioesterase
MEAPKLDIMADDRVARHFGMEALSHGDGKAVVRFAIEDKHLNALGTVQGGAIFSLADVAFALACNSRGLAVAANASINFCSAARSGVLTATARELSLSNKLGSYLVEVRDQDDRLVASMQGLAYRKTR